MQGDPKLPSLKIPTLLSLLSADVIPLGTRRPTPGGRDPVVPLKVPHNLHTGLLSQF